MSVIKIDAGLFRIVHMTVSTEETRYYLNGVHVEPHASGGALMVSTDGHRLLAAYDPAGVCSEAAIIQLPKHALALSKRPKLIERRELVVDVQNAVATINNVTQAAEPGGEPLIEMVAACQANVIDGTFPDWRRVVPTKEEPRDTVNPATLNGGYVRVFGDICKELQKHFERSSAGMQLALTDGASPVVVRWSGFDEVFGVIMPMRGDVRGHLPEFVAPAEFRAAAE